MLTLPYLLKKVPLSFCKLVCLVTVEILIMNLIVPPLVLFLPSLKYVNWVRVVGRDIFRISEHYCPGSSQLFCGQSSFESVDCVWKLWPSPASHWRRLLWLGVSPGAGRLSSKPPRCGRPPPTVPPQRWPLSWQTRPSSCSSSCPFANFELPPV